MPDPLFHTTQSRHDEIAAACRAFHKEHPEVWTRFERFALEMARAGRTRYSAKCVMERVRWETDAGGGKPFKINNNFTALYARRFARLHPEHADFFSTRRQNSRESTARGQADRADMGATG